MRFDPAECPECGDEEWEVLHESHPGAPRTDATLKCSGCGRTVRGAIEWPREMPLRCILSHGAESTPTTLPWPSDTRVRVGAEAFMDGRRVVVTSIEHKSGKRVRSAATESVSAVWVKVFDRIQVKVSMNLGPSTQAGAVELGPDDPVHVGDVFDVAGHRARVDHIKTERGVLHQGAVAARDIVRLYAKPVGHGTDGPDPRERRDAPPARRPPPW